MGRMKGYVIPHALERYRIHYPDAEFWDVLQAVEEGEERDPELVQALLGRTKVDHGSTYVSAHDGRGIFVIQPGDPGPKVVTYLRLQESQRAILLGKETLEQRRKVEEAAALLAAQAEEHEKIAKKAAKSKKAKQRDEAYYKALETRYAAIGAGHDEAHARNSRLQEEAKPPERKKEGEDG